MTRRHLAALILAGSAIPMLALYASVGWRAPDAQEVLWSDLPWYFTPTFAVLHRALAEGFFPLWNPWQLAGWPFLAAFQTQVLYFPAWAVAWLPPHLAVTVYNSLHWASAFVGMAVFAGSIGMSAVGGAAAATLYALSGPVTGGFFTHSAGLAVASWLPWCAWTATRLARSKRPLRPLLAFAATVAIALLAGAPEHFLYLVAAVGFVALWQGAAGRERPLTATIVLVAAGFALAALLASAQILPTIELMSRAVRSSDTFTSEYIARFQAATPALVRAASGISRGPGHLTMLMLPLTVAALAAARTRRAALVALVAGLLVLDHLRGNNGYVFPFVYRWLPFVRAFRTQLRAEFVWAFFGSIAAAYGVEAIGGARAAIGGARALTGSADASDTETGEKRAIAPATAVARVRRYAAILVAVLLLAEAGSRALSNKVFVVLGDPALLYGTTDLAEALASAPGPDRLFIDAGPPAAGLQLKFGQMHGVRQVSDYDALVPDRYARLFAMPREKPWMGRLQFRSHTKDLGFRSVDVPGVELSDLDLLSARWYLGLTRNSEPWLESYVHGTTRYRGEYTVVERPAARPRTYVVHQAVSATSPDDALQKLHAAGFDPATSAIVTGPAPPLDLASGDAESARIAADEPNRVEIDASCNGRCLLVLTDLAFPGWSATIDGAAAPILETNYLLRGVALAGGAHHVSFVYRPASFLVGLTISAASLAGVLVLLARTRARASNPDTR